MKFAVIDLLSRFTI